MTDKVDIEALRRLMAFLNGEAHLGGKWFGYPSLVAVSKYENAFWWRDELRRIDVALDELEALQEQNRDLIRCLFPVQLMIHQNELADEELSDDHIALSFSGSGASDQVTVGMVRKALRMSMTEAPESKP